MKDPIVTIPPSFPRFILWETVSIVGFFHILLYAPAIDPTPLLFLANAAIFIGLYPVVYYHGQIRVHPFLRVLLPPLQAVSRVVLMVSGFLWITYILYASGYFLGLASTYLVVKDYWMFLAPFFAVDYFFFFEHVWGLSQANYAFWPSLGMISDSVSGVVGGFVLGRLLFVKWGLFPEDREVQGVIWIIFILVGIAIVVWYGHRTRQSIAAPTEVTPTPSLALFILWETVGFLGFTHVLFFGSTNDPVRLYFLSNILVFLILYPVLYFYHQLRFPPVLKFLVYPLSVTLRLVLLVSSFIGTTYLLYATGYVLGSPPAYLVVKDYWMVLVPFFVLDYFIFFEHIWGLSRVNFSFWSSIGMLSDSVSGVVGGYTLGRILDTKWGGSFGDSNFRALIWIIFILIGIAVVVWFGNKTRKG